MNKSEIEEAFDYIFEMDFNAIIHKMVRYQYWRVSEAKRACHYYRRYLLLLKKYAPYFNYRLPPTEDVDCFWHQHILDTQRYMYDCQIIFGRYLHHYPYFGIDAQTNFDDLNNSFKQMQELHQLEFGEPIPAIRSAVSPLISKVEWLTGYSKASINELATACQ